MKQNKCKLCKETDKTHLSAYNINFKPYILCEICADSIMQQQLQSNLQTKWKTYREITKEAKK